MTIIDQRWAIIAHLDVLAALDGEAVCRLVLVDIAAGREAGELCVAGKAWEKRKDVFSIPVDELAVRVPVAPVAEGVPTPSPASDAPTPSALTPQEQQDAVRARPTPDEGEPMTDTFDLLQAKYEELGRHGSPPRAWISRLAEEATRGGVPFHAKGNRTERRYHILRALILLARQGPSDDAVRGLLEPILGPCAQYPAVPVGQLLGSLGAREAQDFAALVDGSASIEFGPDGRPHLAA